MPEEIVQPAIPEEEEEIHIPKITSSLQALTLIFRSMQFLLANYKKTTIVVLAILIFVIINVLTNFVEFKKLLSLVGL